MLAELLARYEAFDMSRAAKTRGQDVIGTLENLAEKVMRKTGFFRNGDNEFDEPQVQNGVARTNCIDCLDRTNVTQVGIEHFSCDSLSSLLLIFLFPSILVA